MGFPRAHSHEFVPRAVLLEDPGPASSFPYLNVPSKMETAWVGVPCPTEAAVASDMSQT